jgi:hypothetical protein
MFDNLIASATVGSGGATIIEFASIPQTYTDLTIVISGRSSSTSFFDWGIQVNGDGTTSKPQKQLIGTGSSSATYSNTLTVAGYTGRVPLSTDTSSTFGSSQIFIPNYTGSMPKIWSAETIVESNQTVPASGIASDINGGSFGITSAITSLSVRYIVAGVIAAAEYTTVYVYGTLKGSGGATVS